MSSKRTRTSLGAIAGVSALGFAAIFYAVNQTPTVVEKIIIVEKPVIKEVIREVEKKPVPIPQQPQRANERPIYTPPTSRCNLDFNDRLRSFNRINDDTLRNLSILRNVINNKNEMNKKVCEGAEKIMSYAERALNAARNCDVVINSQQYTDFNKQLLSPRRIIEHCHRDGFL